MESSPHQVLAYDLSFGTLDGHLTGIAESIDNWFVVDKAPTIVAKGPKFLNYLQLKGMHHE